MEPVQENILRGLTEMKAGFFEINQGVDAYAPHVVSSIFRNMETLIRNGGTEGLVFTKVVPQPVKRRGWFG